jgi:predicted Zn-dependent protease with MMP-like domain
MGLFRRHLDPKEALDRVSDLYDAGEYAAAWKEVERALRANPGDLDLEEYAALLAEEDGRLEEALRILEKILAAEPGRSFAKRERASVLIDLGRFGEVLGILKELRGEEQPSDDPAERASLRFETGLCLDRAGRIDEADREFRAAVRLDPEDYQVPPRMSAGDFDALVAAVLDSIPALFQPYLRQVAVMVRDYPAPDANDPFLLGLYVGTPMTDRAWDSTETFDGIFIFKRNHELLNAAPAEIREEVRKTVIHEIAHHFGLGEDDMGEYA